MSVIDAERIQLRPSWTGAALLTVGHAMGFVYCLYGFPPWAKLVVGVAIAYSAWASIWRDTLMHGRSTVCAIELGEGKCGFINLFGESCRGRIANSSRVMPFLLRIDLRLGDGKNVRRLIVPRDAVSADEFRRLRVELRCLPREEAE
jgi:hypothetical protein